MESFAELGLFTTNTNVNNEMGTLRSPDVMHEVVTRLHLEMNYQADGRFHKQTLYGNTLPLSVNMINFPENESASFRCNCLKRERWNSLPLHVTEKKLVMTTLSTELLMTASRLR